MNFLRRRNRDMGSANSVFASSCTLCVCRGGKGKGWVHAYVRLWVRLPVIGKARKALT